MILATMQMQPYIAGERSTEPGAQILEPDLAKGVDGETPTPTYDDRDKSVFKPDLTIDTSGIFWTEVAKINSRTKPTRSDQVLNWEDVDEWPCSTESIKCRRPSSSSPNWSGPYTEIMAAMSSVADTDEAKQSVLEIIRSEQAQLRNCIEQLHFTNAALKWISMDPGSGHIQLLQLVSVNRWLKCERSQIRITSQKLKSNAEQTISSELVSPHDQESDAGAADSRANFSTPNIIRYDVMKINRVNRNSRRIFEIDVRQHSLSIIKPEYRSTFVPSPVGSVHSQHSQSLGRSSTLGSQRDLLSFCDDPENILLSNTMIIDVRLVSVPISGRRLASTQLRAEIHVEYLTHSMRKSKIFKGLMANVAERDQLYKHICLYVLQKPNLLLVTSPDASSTMKSTAPIGTIRASTTARRAFSATCDARIFSRSLIPGVNVPSSEEEAQVLPILAIAERAHSNWALDKLSQKWTMGKRIDLFKQMHTELVPFNELNQEDQLFKVESVRRIIDSICDFGYTIQPSESGSLSVRNALESADKQQLLSVLAVTLHETWIDATVNAGWRFGSHFNDAEKRHPNLTPFSCLDSLDSSEYRTKAQFVIDAISELGLSIQYSHRHARANSRVQSM